MSLKIAVCAGSPRLRIERGEAGDPDVSAPRAAASAIRMIEHVKTLSPTSRLIYEFRPEGVRSALNVDARDVLVSTPARNAH